MKLDQSFSRNQRLTRSKNIQQVLEKGQKYVGEFFILFIREELEQEDVKVCFLVPKKLGKAHVRNRVKRLGREAFRRQKHLFGGKLRLVFLARAGGLQWDYKKVFDEIADLAKKIRT